MCEKIRLESQNLTEEKVKEMKRLFPEVFIEGKIDFTRLRQILGETVDKGSERYGLSWAGKSDCMKNIQTPSVATLKPCRQESVNFDQTRNLIIEGDNLEVLKLLQKSYHGKVKMIYIDPPYNKGKDFVYCDNYHEPLKNYLKLTGQVDEEGTPLTTNLETSGRFHSAWLTMMYPRLFLARNLLKEDGVIFVSIDENEVHNLRLLMNEVFGEENFINILHVKRAAKNVNQQFANLKKLNLGIEYVLVYQKSDAFAWSKPYKEASAKRKQGYWTSFYNNADRPTMRYELLGVTITKGQWKWEKERALKAVENYREFQNRYSVANEEEELRLLKQFWQETGQEKEFIKLKNGRPHYWVCPSENQLRTTDWTDLYINDNRGKEKYGFDTVKNVTAIKTFIYSATTGDGDIVLDFFAGSGTTAHAVMDLNREDGGKRRFILVQLPEPTGNPEFPTIAEICKERVRRVIQELNEEFPDDELKQDRGFKVFKLDESNFKIWGHHKADANGEELARRLELFVDPIKPGSKQEDILYELLLKSGLDLNSKLEKIDLQGKTVFSVAENLMLICLEDTVTKNTIQKMIELGPAIVVCLDSAFGGNDQLKTNTVLDMKAKGIEFRTV